MYSTWKQTIFVQNNVDMAKEYICITRKIQVVLHKHGETEEALKRYNEEYRMWRAINENLYKAANYIISHCFFNDAYEERLRIHNPRYKEVEKLLKYSKKNKLSEDEVKELKMERNVLLKQFKEQKKNFLKTSEQNSIYKVVSEEFVDIIPSNILTCLNQNISSTYSCYRKEVEQGKRTIPNYKRGIPVPFSIKQHGELLLQRRSDGSFFVRFPFGAEWDLFFGRDKSNNKEIVERVLNGTYDAGDSSIQECKNGKIFLLLVVKIPKQEDKLNPNRIVGIDLGINVPLYAALNDNEYGGLSIGSREHFLNVRMRMAAQKRELQQSLQGSTNGGRGRRHKLQALERLQNKERNWVHLQNHIFSKAIIDFALKHKAGVIQMEHLTGFGHDENDEVVKEFKFVLRYWSFYELQQLIEYKAEAAGIVVRYVNPYHTSQKCSFCGHYENGQRVSQSVFICRNTECSKGKGKNKADGTFSGINADWNAARNIALSKDFVAKKNNKH